MDVKINGLNLSEAILKEMAPEVEEGVLGKFAKGAIPFLGGAAAGVAGGVYSKFQTEKNLEYKLKQDPKFQEIMIALKQHSINSPEGQEAFHQLNSLRVDYGLPIITDPNDVLVYLNKINTATSEDYAEEGQGDQQDPTVRDLNHLLTIEKEPWKQNLTKWRIQYYLDGKNDAENPSVPLDSQGHRKPVVDSETWIKQNPTLISRGLVPSDCLPPTMHQPGMLDRLKTGLGINEDLDRIKTLKNHLLG